ncbi:MAG: hypothetical protein ABEI78_01175 [Candidatus Nanohaloarchaea archaeon]
MKIKNNKILVLTLLVILTLGIASASTSNASQHKNNLTKEEHHQEPGKIGSIYLTLVYLIGISAGIVLIIYSLKTWKKTKGSQVGVTAKFVLIGSLTFTFAFTAFMINHVAGLNIWYFIDNHLVERMWDAWLLTTTILFYTLGYRKLFKQAKGGVNQ